MPKPKTVWPLREGSVASRVVALLREHGPMTRFKLDGLLPGVEKRVIARTVATLARPVSRRGNAVPKRVYIRHWERDDELGDSRRYLRPVYAAGNRPDAPRPPPLTQNEYGSRRWAKHIAPKRAAKALPNSVFALAESRT